MADTQKLHSVYPLIQYRARLNPHAVAVVTGPSQQVTFATFCTHIERVTRRLHKEKIAPSARVAVHVEDMYLNWLVAIALSRLALLSASLSNAKTRLLMLKPDVVVTDHPGGLENFKVVTVDTGWYEQAADDLPAFVDVAQSPDTPLRIVLSSGTTGKPKMALITLGQLRARIGAGGAITSATRLLVTMGISTLGGYQTPVTCWALGASVILVQQERGQRTWGLIASMNATMLVVAPTQLDGLLSGMPADAQPQANLLVYVGGAELPRAVNRKARLRLTPQLYMAYGSTEAGGVAIAHALAADTRPGFTGYLMPTAQVEIVDEAGKPVPAGTLGEVRIRAEGMIERYVDEDDTSDSPLRDGWFYPGDAGTLEADGGLSILGRTVELINVGGVKVSPTYLEQALSALPGIEDIAVFGLETPKGVRACAAVIAGEGFEEERLAARFKRSFPTMPPLVLARVGAIPRNEMGKVMRSQLAESVRGAALRQKKTEPSTG